MIMVNHYGLNEFLTSQLRILVAHAEMLFSFLLSTNLHLATIYIYIWKHGLNFSFLFLKCLLPHSVYFTWLECWGIHSNFLLFQKWNSKWLLH